MMKRLRLKRTTLVVIACLVVLAIITGTAFAATYGTRKQSKDRSQNGSSAAVNCQNGEGSMDRARERSGNQVQKQDRIQLNDGCATDCLGGTVDNPEATCQEQVRERSGEQSRDRQRDGNATDNQAGDCDQEQARERSREQKQEGDCANSQDETVDTIQEQNRNRNQHKVQDQNREQSKSQMQDGNGPSDS